MEGTYRARARTWELGQASTGTEQIAVYFEYSDPDLKGEGITWFGFFSEATWKRTIESLRHMGWKGEDLSDLQGLDANEVDLVIGEETYQDKTQTKVKWVNRLGGVAQKAPLGQEQAKTLAQKMREKIRAMDAAAGKKVAPVGSSSRPPPPPPVGNGSPEPPPLKDEDLPF